MQVKTLHKIKEYAKAEDISSQFITLIKKLLPSNDMIQVEEEMKEQAKPEVYWKYAVKCAYIKSKQFQLCMEYKKSKSVLENDAKPILVALIKTFHKVEGESAESIGEPILELPHNQYAFTYRKKFA